MPWSFIPMFSSKHFLILGLSFKSLIHFELIFVIGISYGPSFILLHVDIQSSQHHLLKRLSFFHWVFLAPLSNISWLYRPGFISGLSVLFHWLICPFLCWYHIVLMIIVLYYSLKQSSLMPPALLFFLRISLATWDLLWFRINFRSVYSTCVKSAIGILIWIAVNL